MANHFFHPDLTSGLGGHLSNMDISRFRTSPLSWVKQNEVNFNDGSFFSKTTNKKSAVSATSPRHKEMPSFQHSYQVLGSLTQMKMIPMKATRGLRHLGPGWECEKPVMTCGRSRLVWKDLTLILTAPRNVFEYSTRFGLQSYETFQFVRDNDCEALPCHTALDISEFSDISGCFAGRCRKVPVCRWGTLGGGPL